MNISEFLLSGIIELNQTNKCLEIKNTQEYFEYSKIKPDDWGLVYEKYVGQILENEGFIVTYRGLKLGLGDRGIDIIAEDSERKLFVQCKFWKKQFGKNQIEWILYKASGILHETWKTDDRRIYFVLITPDKDLNFKKKGKKIYSNLDPSGLPLKYPYLEGL